MLLFMYLLLFFSFFFFFIDTATTEIYTLSLHDALPISTMILPSALLMLKPPPEVSPVSVQVTAGPLTSVAADRKSTRLNSSHVRISYAVFCLKKKKKTNKETTQNKRITQKTKPLSNKSM